jgi:hypothetical protein
MDREHVKDAPDKIKGTIKDTAGRAAGDQVEIGPFLGVIRFEQTHPHHASQT